MNHKIMPVLVSAAIAVSGIPFINAHAESSDYSDLYKEKLYEFMESEHYSKDSAFELCELGNGDVPELIISEGKNFDSKCYIYTYYDGEVHELGTYGTFGTIGYCKNSNAILSIHDGGCWESGTYYTLHNRRSFQSIFSYSNMGICKINNYYFSIEEYKEITSKYNVADFDWIGRENELTDEGITTGFIGNWRKIYKKELERIRSLSEFDDRTMFDIYDVNKDGIPELFVSFLNNYKSQCVIYTVMNGNLIYLNELDSLTAEIIPDKNWIAARQKTYQNNSFTEYCSITDGFLKPELTFGSIIGEFGKTFSINNTEVSEEEYNDKTKRYSYQQLLFLGRRFHFGDKSIETALNPPSYSLTDEQKIAYCKKLSEYYTSHFATFDLFDLNGDSSPELIISTDYSAYVYFFDDKNLTEEELKAKYPVYSLNYKTDKNVFYTEYTHDSIERGNIYKIKGNEFSKIISYINYGTYFESRKNTCACGNEEQFPIYSINDEEVTKEEYEHDMSEYNEISNDINLGRRYRIDPYDISESIFGDHSFISQLIPAAMILNIISETLLTMEG